jgi:acyl-CoA reductase-like NAD-dependent aldehyde dehydrogenase
MGQTYAALKRFYVHADQYDEVCEKLAVIANSQVVGDGMTEGTTFGPVQNKAQLDLVEELVNDAKSNGAKINGIEFGQFIFFTMLFLHS